MAARRRGWLRPLLVATLAAFALLAFAAGAQAKVIRLTGQTTITPSQQAAGFLAAQGVSVSPVGAATAQNGAFTFPIRIGFGHPETFNGILVHRGGLRFTKGDRSAVVRRFVAVRFGRFAYVLAQVPGLQGGCRRVRSALRLFLVRHPVFRRRAGRRIRRFVLRHPAAARRVKRALKRYCSGGRVIVLARLRNLGASVSGNTATLTADLHLHRQAARLINRALDTNVPPGVLIGSSTSTVTPAS
jgi:hypothetical protein